MNTLTNNFRNYITLIALLAVSTSCYAKIDFEGFGPLNSPLEEGEFIAVLRDQGVDVTFKTYDQFGNESAPFIVRAGEPRVGFQSDLFEDTPVNADGTPYAAGGDYSLTDGLLRTHDYALEFSRNVANLSLDVYDFRGDGTPDLANLGVDSLRLNVFDRAGNMIAFDEYVLPADQPVDGNVVQLSVRANNIASARVDFSSIEGGTAIDNIQFTVPEPTSLGLASFGVVGFLGRRKKRRRG